MVKNYLIKICDSYQRISVSIMTNEHLFLSNLYPILISFPRRPNEQSSLSKIYISLT